MAKIIENTKGRRLVELNTNDIINIVREYQRICTDSIDYEETRNRLDKEILYLPEDIY